MEKVSSQYFGAKETRFFVSPLRGTQRFGKTWFLPQIIEKILEKHLKKPRGSIAVVQPKKDVTNITYLEEETGFRFIDRTLFQQSFVHRSYVNERKIDTGDNERLEFLGDSVLSLAVSQHLYRLFPDYTEGELTRLRSMLVRRETLARLARRLHLDEYLLLGHGEEASGGRERQATLCAVYEAVLGAVFVDQGFDAALDFALKTLEGELNAAIAFNLDQDPKSRLQEYIQGRYNETPSFRNSFTEGPDHAKHYIMTVNMKAGVIGVGQGHSKKIAGQKAAGMALFWLGQPAPEYDPDELLESKYDLYDPSQSHLD